MSQTVTPSADVVIVGGGVIGSAVACFLATDPGWRGRVAVIERDPSYEHCTSARSVGGIRQQFSTPENILMSRFAAELVRDADRWLGVDGETPALEFREAGYLFLASAAGRAALEASHAVQRDHGAESVLLEPDALAERFPWLATEGVALGSLGLSDEGWVDPYALLQGFRRKARAGGALYHADEVTGLERRGDRVEAVRLRDGGRIACGQVVNAAGARAAEIAALAGLDVPVRPRKRQVFVVECRTPLPRCPLVIDPSGTYFRPESGRFLCGRSPPPEADPDTLDHEVDWRQFEDELWPLLAARVPAFEALRAVNAWACTYAYNTVDQNAILGPHPEVPNLVLANGFSGHGLQQSPAVGRAVAELIVHGAFRTLDLSRFGADRFAAGRTIVEAAVV